MPLDFLKRRSPQVASTPAATAAEAAEVEAQDYALRLHYHAKTSEGVRMKAGPEALRELPEMLAGLTEHEVEVIQPLEVQFAEAAPDIKRSSEAMQWLNAHHADSPVVRHALVVLESLGAIDLAFDTFACTLLHGDVDTSGYPEFNAIVGGVASHWDEVSGDMIVRGVVGWGGKGVRGDTDRIAAKILAGIVTNVLASQYAVGLTTIERPVPAAGRGGLVCAHCGFASAHERAFYCPKCGMRLLRG